MSNILMTLRSQARRRARGARLIVAALSRGNAGGLLIETVIAMFVFTLVGTAVLRGISTTQVSGSVTETQAIAENLARNEAEYVMTLPYIPPGGGDYEIDPDLLPLPPGYTLSATPEILEIQGAQDPDPNSAEKVVVTVGFGGGTVLTLETIKTND